MDWDKLRIFHAVAEAGSFTHAGETLNLSQSAISRQISALEQSLNVPLFHRHARGLILTEQGEDLYLTAHEVFHKVAMTEARLTESKEQPEGPLKITTTVGFGSVWLTPRIKEFMDLYPEINVTILLVYDDLDLAMREADVAIRLTPPRQPDLIQRHLMSIHYKVYASPEYLQEHGMPQTPEDLDQHNLVTFGEEVGDQTDLLPALNFLQGAGAKGGRRKPVLQVNNVYGIYRAVRSGVGIGALPDYFIEGSSNLVHILPELQSPQTEVYFVYPEELRQSARIAVFRDFLVRKILESRK
ncbi:MAG: LysR family transcriptional regulator [Rhodospirillaceae bacterium]|jgi:DNA-binding transcriptional LysR family regulator|nr:LysR family transcriptional regulator [Rhodospirillaceae bacterium]MBT4589867.1 LysR family transcriptional regulator [Rhodospirillaceae bacterium]MBT4937534.1 LysR family transcriptional regulator [Rhodospirillaceae bacterium]MBT5939142.1 LysR family transcriptional regulator [Rhodospirillaceae bacterium]